MIVSSRPKEHYSKPDYLIIQQPNIEFTCKLAASTRYKVLDASTFDTL